MPCSSIRWCCAGTGAPTGWCRPASPRQLPVREGIRRLRLGLLSDLGSRHEIFLDLDAAPGGLGLELENYLFSPGRRPPAGPLQLPSAAPAWNRPWPGGIRRAFLLGSFGCAAGRQPGDAGGRRPASQGARPGHHAGAQLGGFWGSPSTAGLEAELYLRQRLAGRCRPSAGLLHACWQGMEDAGLQRFLPGFSPPFPWLLRRNAS
jgi:hypothetical protein